MNPTYRFGVLKHCILCGKRMWFTSRDWHPLCSLGKMMARSLDNMLKMYMDIERRQEEWKRTEEEAKKENRRAL